MLRKRPHSVLTRCTVAFTVVWTCTCAGALLMAGSAWAERADRNRPMNIEADALRYDDASQTSLFSGNVAISKGTLILRADRIEVKQDKEGHQLGTATASAGKRVFFRQKRDPAANASANASANPVEEWVEGEAEKIIYDSKADIVTFSGNAKLRRLRGSVVSDETQGAVITYDNNSDVFSVQGGVASGKPSGRIRAVISPKDAASAPAQAAPAAPAAPSSTLRPSMSLGTSKK